MSFLDRPQFRSENTYVASTDYTTLLHAAGLRVTEPRLAVLAEIEQGGHVSADELRQRVTARIGSVSTQAIYDIVHALTRVGLLREIKPAGHVSLFEISRDDNHHHLVCRECGRIEDVPCAVGYRPCLVASDDHGYIIDEAEVTFWGLCPDCQKQAAAAENPTPAHSLA
ncbi:MAG: transcriptional repressor [Actinomycetaceae bacterium]|nr:transcriptional repressor [Actinomycetaceae bacterium]